QYTNHHFGFRLSYGQGWRDVPRSELAARSQRGTESQLASMMVTLTRNPLPGRAEGASLTMAAERLPEGSPVRAGQEYLDVILRKLNERSDRPAEVTREPPQVLAGMEFARVSFRRPWGDSSVGMTFWATVTKGYAVLITGTYASPEGREDIEG